MMTYLLRICLLVFALSGGVIMLPEQARAAETPQIIKTTMYVRARRMLRYWKVPNQDNYWSWIPEVGFQTSNAVEAGSQFYAEFTLPDGKPWTTLKMTVPEGRPFQFYGTEWESGHQDPRAIVATGVCGFKIRWKNPLEGQDEVVYQGRFKVNKFHVGNELPAFKNQFEYYVDNDWTLPIGYVWLNPQERSGAQPFSLMATMWFRGQADSAKLAAYVFYNGKQIAGTKEQGQAGKDFSILTAGNDADTCWERWTFNWGGVRAYNYDNRDGYFLNQNPGVYEVKVLRNGKLVRTATFTVDKNGLPVDNGIATQNKLGLPVVVMPVKVLGDQDGMWDATAWKTQAFYGNPLTGFTAP